MRIVTGRYTEAKVYASVIEDEALAQIKTLCDQESSIGSNIAIMPDVHAGKGCTIGTTMTIGNKIIPNLVGVDIGCGLSAVEASGEIDLSELDSAVINNIPCGFNIRNKEHRFVKELRLEELVCKEVINLERAKLSLGTLGGGNHFIEVNKSESGKIYIVVHSGSRNLGLQVAKHYQSLAYEKLKDSGFNEARQNMIRHYKMFGMERKLEQDLKELKKECLNAMVSYDLAYLVGKDFSDYIHDMKIVQEYASWNRQVMLGIIFNELKLKAVDKITTVHNYIDTNRMILRKGAVSAQADEILLIPINMRDGVLLCKGKGNKDWNYSAPHGAGRLMSRSKAKSEFTLEEFKRIMGEANIYSSSVGQETLDECPMAYKPIDVIKEDIKDTVEIIDVLKPIYNFKASE